MRAKQLSFLPKQELQHGGILSKGRRKTARPMDPKRPLHLVLRSSRAKGPWSLLHPKNERRVKHELEVTSAKYGIRVYRFANVGNHLQHTGYDSVTSQFSGIPSRIFGSNRRPHYGISQGESN